MLPQRLNTSRNVWTALARGARGRCPNCGVGKIFSRYLKVAETCPTCGTELFHQRADDAPAYVTIFIVGHIVVGSLLVVEDLWPTLPIALHMAVWPVVAVLLSLVLLPVIKGSLVTLQWALRMHGFAVPGSDPHHFHG